MADLMLAKYGMSRDGHALFAPSSSSGWLNCPGYLLANAVVGDTAGVDAAYGTVAHTIAEDWRSSGYRPDEKIGKVATVNGHDIVVDRSMLDYIQQFIQWCDEVPGDVFVEEKVDISDYLPIPKQRGTADHFVCAPGLLTITDLKMGTGVKVFVERNPQAMLYALGAFTEWDWMYGFQRIVIRICQPRLDYFGVWECSRGELLEFGEYVRERSKLAWREDAPRIPGEKQCRFCRVSKTCPALSMHLDSLADDSFDAEGDPSYGYDEMKAHETVAVMEGAPEPGDPLALSSDFLAYRLRFRKMYEKWFRAIDRELVRRASSGENIPGWKLVSGRRSYEWSDVTEVTSILTEAGVPEDEIMVTQIVSVSGARDLLKARKIKPKQVKELLKNVVVEVPGKPALAPSFDERQDSQEAVDDAFDADDDGDL